MSQRQLHYGLTENEVEQRLRLGYDDYRQQVFNAMVEAAQDAMGELDEHDLNLLLAASVAAVEESIRTAKSMQAANERRIEQRMRRTARN